MRSVGAEALRRAPHLRQLVHQAALRVQAAGGVDDDVVGVARFGRLQRVEEHGRGIAARLVLDDFGSGAIAPDFQLLDGGGAKGIGSGQQNGLALRPQQMRQLADRGGLAGAVHADDQNDFGLAIDFLYRPVIGGVEDRQQLVLQHALELVDIGDLLAIDFFAQRVEDGCSWLRCPDRPR